VNWLVTSILANGGIVVLEYLHRTSSMSAWNVARIVPVVILCQWAIWSTWKNAPSVMTAWVCLTFGNTILRVLNTHFLLHEPMTGQTWLAVGLMTAGAVVMNWR
jgi:uncharacterized membrane protein